MSSTGRSFIVTKVSSYSENVRDLAGPLNLGEFSVLEVEIPSPFSGELSFDRFFIAFCSASVLVFDKLLSKTFFVELICPSDNFQVE